MPSREEIIKAAEDYEPYARVFTNLTVKGDLFLNMLALLKKQEEKPLRCKTCTVRDKTGFCYEWKRKVKDDDYCSFGVWEGR